jgi:hypothetical protein
MLEHGKRRRFDRAFQVEAVWLVESVYIESFNGRLRNQCLNGERFFFLTLADAQQKLAQQRADDYNPIEGQKKLFDLAEMGVIFVFMFVCRRIAGPTHLRKESKLGRFSQDPC